MITTVDEHLFDSSSTRRVWQYRSISLDIARYRSISADRKHMNISVELSDVSSYGGFFALTVGSDDSAAAGWHPVGRSYADGAWI